jgi:hypothetical protein
LSESGLSFNVSNAAQQAAEGAGRQGKRDKGPNNGKGRDTARVSAKKTANVAREDTKKAKVWP